MTLPNTLIIGAQKAGSSWLSRNLSQHPEIFMHGREVHYFNLERHYRKGIAWYERRFEQVQNEKVVAEKTPNYLWITPYTVRSRFGNHLASVHQKIHAALPEAKLIVVLRDPVERAISAVNHYRTLGQISPFTDIDTVLDCRKLNHQNPLEADGFGIFGMGKYYEHLSAYYKYYRRSQILIINFETDIAVDPQAGLRKVCDFLEIDASFNFKGKQKRQNKFDAVRYGTALTRHLFPKRVLLSKAVSKLPKQLIGNRVAKCRPSERTLERLYDFYAEDNQRLYALIDRKFESWGKTSHTLLCGSSGLKNRAAEATPDRP